MNASVSHPGRSWLIVPASRDAAIDEAARAGADVVVLDLFELLADKDKAAARGAMRSSIERARTAGAAVYAQVDPGALEVDLDAAVWPGLAGVVIARAETTQQIGDASLVLDRLERERAVTPGTVRIVAALETARGNHSAYDVLTASPRVHAATLGRADLVMDLRAEPSGEIHLMPYLMQRLVIVCGAAGVTPLGAWWRASDRGLLATPDNTYHAAKRGRAIGFKGAMCLRGDQVAGVNEAFAAVHPDRPERSASGVEG